MGYSPRFRDSHLLPGEVSCSVFDTSPTCQTSSDTLHVLYSLSSEVSEIGSPMARCPSSLTNRRPAGPTPVNRGRGDRRPDRKSTRLNSSHPSISYAVFCLKIKKQQYD